MAHEDASDKFDKFIEDFDQTLNKDTSTSKTIMNPIERSTTPENHQQTSKITSPILTTPTKSYKDSIPLESQPLSESNHPSIESLSHKRSPSGITKLPNGEKPLNITPRTNGGRIQDESSIKGSNTTSVIRSAPKKGLNLNLSINKEGSLLSPSLESPETPSISNVIDPMAKLSLNGDGNTRNRRRTNSSVSNRSSMTTNDLMTDEINDSLRALALKEMKIIELKDELRLLQQRIDKEEQELVHLRHKVGNNFREISPIHQNPRKKRISTDSNHFKSPSRDPAAPLKQVASRDSVWSKPISFLNQFDQILQNEIEKLNREAFPQQSLSTESSQQTSLQSTESQNSQRSRARENRVRNPTDAEPISNGDMLNTVSNSLWSFVTDVKQGLLGDDNYEERPTSRGKQKFLATKRQQLQNVNSDFDRDENEAEEMITYRKSKGD